MGKCFKKKWKKWVKIIIFEAVFIEIVMNHGKARPNYGSQGYKFLLINPSFCEDRLQITRITCPTDRHYWELDNTTISFSFEIYLAKKTSNKIEVIPVLLPN